MESLPLLDRAGRRRSPATTSSFHQGVPPRNKGRRYPPDPPTVEEIIAVMYAAGEDPDGLRLRGVIVMLWRAGLRVSEALSLNETDLDPDRGAVLVRHGKRDKRREVGMDRWAWAHLEPWLELRTTLPAGALFCVVRGPTRGRPCAPAGIRSQLHRTAELAGVRRLRAASAAARPRGRDVARGDLADRYPATARACRSRDHISIPARNRQLGDHPDRPPAPRANDPGRSTTLAIALSSPSLRTISAHVVRPRSLAASPRYYLSRRSSDRYERWPRWRPASTSVIGPSPMQSPARRQDQGERSRPPTRSWTPALCAVAKSDSVRHAHALPAVDVLMG